MADDFEIIHVSTNVGMKAHAMDLEERIVVGAVRPQLPLETGQGVIPNANKAMQSL